MDLGCNAGGYLSCHNGGICFADGSCQYPTFNWLDLTSSTLDLSTTEKNYL